ncbi:MULTISPECIES: SDR family oxidoreductase [unclassified Sphingomonas]|uniref:SDR family oxidoreductase n=1 Tax=unclassified Sphingomonas TaxID=196159 RepID=UPI0006F81601|nr:MULTISPECIES: SDR family oxidoreductase [unclassified Sphingomonas]KQX18604.1 3-oxoacyl-ACP reductase [Sphingomonas sp. Root1294]KQY72073.1 3-oxoacyl-ACP reductase [Sphingomonas sp. Root50]KRB94658.1 3-oxoacyl-ACP reductase [Sphingomonas sp. Root720]
MDSSSLFRLDDRVALVTGGSSGIGKMIAAGFVAQGAKVYITSRKAGMCAATAEELGSACIALPQDVSSVEGCARLAAALGEREARLHILVNNAGAAWAAPLGDFPEQGWDKVFDINLKAPFFLTQSLLPLLKADREGGHPAKVINIASIEGIRLSALETYSYHASKAGLIHLTRRLAAQLVVDGVIVNAIAPGAFASAMNRNAREDSDRLSRLIPARRIGDPEDIAAAAIYLASRAGNYVVGETIAVDGGLALASTGATVEP